MTFHFLGFFVPCLLRDSDNEEFLDNILAAILARCVGSYAARLGTGKLTLQSWHRRLSFVNDCGARNSELKIRRRRDSTTADLVEGAWGEVAVAIARKIALRKLARRRVVVAPFPVEV